MNKNLETNKNRKILIIALILGVVVILGIVGIVVYSKRERERNPQSPTNSTLQQAQNNSIQQLKSKLPQIKGTNSQQQQTLSNIYGQIVQSQPNQQAIAAYQNQKTQQLNLLSEVNNLLEEIKTKQYKTIPQIEEDIKKLEKFEVSNPDSNEFWVRYYSLFSEKFIYLREHLKSVSCQLERWTLLLCFF